MIYDKRNIIMFCCAMAIIIALAVTTILRVQKKDEEDHEAKKERFDDGEMLENLLCNRKLKEALLLIDTLHTKYPHDPQSYFCEGWIYDMNNDSVNARRCFKKALSMYDSLISQKDDIGLRFNRAFIVGILYGHDAYNKAVDGMLKFAKNSSDTTSINMYRDLVYDKNEMFKPGSNETWYAKFCCESGNKDEQTVIEFYYDKGNVTSGRFCGTSHEFLLDEGKSDVTGYFILSLSNVRYINDTTVYFELDIRGNRFFRKSPYNHYWSSNEAPTPLLLGDGEVPVKDSIVSFVVTLGKKAVNVVNKKNKALRTRVFYRKG